MSFTEELTQLVTIIVALLLVLFGVNFWTKKGGSIKLPSMGNKASGNVEGGINNESVESVDGMGVGQDEGTSAATSGGSAADRNAERFDLTGKNAEAAARVLKGMLNKDEHFKNQSDHR
ncbi:MAG: hypothetical protein HOE48_09525 [Candidatus Latescibacteria bacterium]|jgi:hypothetical protein|nr:hypothetical protein [Candidatus Latescibacterota bacterium]MBT4138144.1 hypothetical protein [Candidatus Latescibacterota bacterium]MBT5829450.1 hypothetical protein [Candidatus Latescibacterota bacterium]